MDPGLARVAARATDVDGLIDLLREEGLPYVRPKLVKNADSATLARLGTPASRCGTSGTTAVVVEALADLDPLPTRARTGQWLTLYATLNAPMREARVVLLGPRGLPRTMPVALDGDHARARFVLDQPGAFTVQLIADRGRGPEPLLEARVFADVEPHRGVDAAPFEEEGDLTRMTNALRSSEKLGALTRDPELDRVAQAHADAMSARGELAHDVGQGTLRERLETPALHIGENVARARTIVLAHRALYASPSHRLNLLGRDYRRLGLGVSQVAGLVYVCEVFAD